MNGSFTVVVLDFTGFRVGHGQVLEDLDARANAGGNVEWCLVETITGLGRVGTHFDDIGDYFERGVFPKDCVQE